MKPSLDPNREFVIGIKTDAGFSGRRVVQIDTLTEAAQCIALLAITPQSQATLYSKHDLPAVSQLVSQQLRIPLDQVTLVRDYATCHSSTACTQAILALSATTRAMLINAAANRWNICPTHCKMESGKVIQKEKSFDFELGELITEAKQGDIPLIPELYLQHRQPKP
ncbi:hypothetical protein [Reichenbachiella sp. MSK19-1]|uniref:hypothetical protein n=1 Tax=Reichenbachiella sp. MSK19-1 TaxID=1897631 RepID=UPI000E6BB4F0|nr:hypothetical protein [Reichenbachiella sp. MSK19-1]RJE75193.1 hypothetical protein BGP76_19010 [Reichenbachiella sp. MSK19-1]